MVVDFSNMGTGRIKGGLPRWTACQNPHNRKVAAVLTSPSALHPILLCIPFASAFLWCQKGGLLRWMV